MSRAVVFGYHQVGVRCLKTLIAGGVDVALVITHEDNPLENIWFPSVARTAAAYDIPVLTPTDPNTPEVIEAVRAARPDFLFSFYYRLMLKAPLLAIPPQGCLNMHGSLLPHYRGRVPVNWAVLHGETQTGATLHYMTEKPDNGDIVGQFAVPILPDDTAGEVFDKVTVAAELTLHQALPALLRGDAPRRVQDLRQGGYFGGRKAEDGRIDWSKSATAVHNLIRAVAPPYPGAFTELGGQTIRVTQSRVEKAFVLTPGRPGLFATGGKLYAACGDGSVLRILAAELGTGNPAEALTPERLHRLEHGD